MKKKLTKKDNPPLAAVTCSPVLAGLIEQLEAAAERADRMQANADILPIAMAAKARAAAFREAAKMARQCQESTQAERQPADKS